MSTKFGGWPYVKHHRYLVPIHAVSCQASNTAEPLLTQACKILPMTPKVPTLYEWLGGAEPLSRLIARFYEKVPADPVLAPLFANMPQEHFQHVAAFIAEVLG